MLSAMFGVAALAVYLRLRETRFDAAVFWSQSALVLSGLTHPMGGTLAAIALTCLFISFGDRRRLRFRTVLLACVPYLVGAAGWVAHILQDPHSFYSQFMRSARGRLQALSPWSALWREVRDRYLAPLDGAIRPTHSRGGSCLFRPDTWQVSWPFWRLPGYAGFPASAESC
jgi:hypothetical protein